jgi:hypothetical protein
VCARLLLVRATHCSQEAINMRPLDHVETTSLAFDLNRPDKKSRRVGKTERASRGRRLHLQIAGSTRIAHGRVNQRLVQIQDQNLLFARHELLRARSHTTKPPPPPADRPGGPDRGFTSSFTVRSENKRRKPPLTRVWRYFSTLASHAAPLSAPSVSDSISQNKGKTKEKKKKVFLTASKTCSK